MLNTAIVRANMKINGDFKKMDTHTECNPAKSLHNSESASHGEESIHITNYIKARHIQPDFLKYIELESDEPLAFECQFQSPKDRQFYLW